MTFLDIPTFFGRLHPLAVHLPIGFLLMAAILDWTSYFSKYKHLRQATPFVLLLGAISAIITCILGWILSTTGEYSYQTLQYHQYGGIGLALLSIGLYLINTPKIKNKLSLRPSIISFTFLPMVLLMGFVGHMGGNLTHGSEYLTLDTLLEKKREKPETLEEALVYEDVIAPILENKCVQCHGQDKRKGELLLSSFESIRKGGKHGPVIKAGASMESELIKRVTLDPKNEEFMPTDGKTPLTETEIALLNWWIESGASGPSTKLTSLAGFATIEGTAADYLELGDGQGTDQKTDSNQAPLNPNIPAEVDENQLAKIEKQGFTVRKMNLNPVMLDVAVAQNNIENPPNLEVLSPLAKNIIWLNLSGSNFTDESLSPLSEFENLEKLRLEENPIGNGSLKYLSKLNYLNALNLYKTNVNSAGLVQLKELDSLKTVYLWQTQANQAELQKVFEDHPQIEFVF